MKINREKITRLRLAITGTPGVGKHTCAKILCKKLDLELIDINKTIIENNCVAKIDKTNGNEINQKKAKKVLKKVMDFEKRFVVVGHLAPYVMESTDIDLIIVLRRNPYQLRKIYKKRRYSASKIKENVSSEILGIISYDVLKVFGKRKVAEIDITNDNIEKNVEKIEKIVNKQSIKEFGKIDWLSLIYENKDVEILLNKL